MRALSGEGNERGSARTRQATRSRGNEHEPCGHLAFSGARPHPGAERRSMCGRFSLTSKPQRLRERFGLTAEPDELTARYNIAPTPAGAGDPESPQRLLRPARWGLVPHWAKDPSIGHRLINVRAETLRAAAGVSRRARAASAVSSRPTASTSGSATASAAGRSTAAGATASRWPSPGCGTSGVRRDGGEPVASCTIVTTERQRAARADPRPHASHPAARRLRRLADRPRARQPRSRAAGWSRARPEWLEAYAVSTWSTSPDHDDPACIAPLKPTSRSEGVPSRRRRSGRRVARIAGAEAETLLTCVACNVAFCRTGHAEKSRDLSHVPHGRARQHALQGALHIDTLTRPRGTAQNA